MCAYGRDDERYEWLKRLQRIREGESDLGDPSKSSPLNEVIKLLENDLKALKDKRGVSQQALAKRSIPAQVTDTLRSYISYVERLRKVDRGGAYRDIVALLEICDLLSRIPALRDDGISVARAEMLREAGAVSSDLYRDYSDITFHIDALAWEVEALCILARLRSRRDVTTTKMVNAINSVSVSAYRLRNYHVSLPLADMAHEIVTVNDEVDKPIAGKVLRDVAAMYLAYGEDLTNGLAVIPWGPQGTSAVQQSMKHSMRAAADAVVAQPSQSWPSRISYNQALSYAGERGEAIANLMELRGELEGKYGTPLKEQRGIDGVKKAALRNLGRCYHQLACLQLEDANANNAASEGILSDAFDNARKAVATRVWLEGIDHVNVRKSFELLKAIERHGHSFEVDASRDVDDAVERVKAHFGDREGLLSVREIVDRIVRGDRLQTHQVFRLTERKYDELCESLGLAGK